MSAQTNGSTVTHRLKNAHRSPWVQLGLYLIPLAAVIWWATHQQAPNWPDTKAEYAWLIGSLVVYAIVTLARGERWHSILGSSGVSLNRGDAYGLTVVGYAGNNVLPARGGELLRIFLTSSRTGAQRRTVLGTILAERILDALALGAILFAVAFNLVQKLGTPSPILTFAVLILIGVAALGAAYAWWKHRHHAERALDAIKPIVVPLRPLLGLRGLALLAASVVIWFGEAAVYGMVAESVGIHLGITGAMSVVAFANLASLIPAAPGYIGTYDAAVVFATKAVTKSSKNVVSYLILLRFVIFVPITITGGLLLFFRYGGLDRIREARQAGGDEIEPAAVPAPVEATNQA